MSKTVYGIKEEKKIFRDIKDTCHEGNPQKEEPQKRRFAIESLLKSFPFWAISGQFESQIRVSFRLSCIFWNDCRVLRHSLCNMISDNMGYRTNSRDCVCGVSRWHTKSPSRPSFGVTKSVNKQHKGCFTDFVTTQRENRKRVKIRPNDINGTTHGKQRLTNAWKGKPIPSEAWKLQKNRVDKEKRKSAKEERMG